MKDLKQNIEDLSNSLRSVVSSFNLDNKRKRIKELEKRSSSPKFWDDQTLATRYMQELGNLKEQVDELESMKNEIKTLLTLAKEKSGSEDLTSEVSILEERINKLKLKTYLSGDYDTKAAIFSIHAGQGGTEAMDWVSMLYRMYIKYCEKRKWKTQLIEMSEGEEAGIKSVTFSVSGSYAYGYLKREAGTHRLVRQSPFNADRLRQTSFALVEVLPELAEVDFPEIGIKDDDLDWQFFRASTQGGQNVQKVSTAVRLKHKPTGITVTCQVERRQEQNRKIALNLLRSKLWIKRQAETEAEKKELKGEYRPASWGNQIRSYVLHPYKMVKDLRTKYETPDTESVLNGNLDNFIEAELKLDN